MNLPFVAWVPDDPERDWSIAAGLAVRWVEDRCREEGASGVLVTNALDHLGVPELDAFERRHTRTSRRAGRNRVGAGAGPVLSYVPYAEELEFAMRLARGSSIAVVETVSFPLSGWAAWLGARNLLTDEPTPPLPETIKPVVDRLVLYGNNGFGDDFGKRQARSILSEFSHQEGLNRDLLLRTVLAARLSARATRNLGRLMDKGS